MVQLGRSSLSRALDDMMANELAPSGADEVSTSLTKFNDGLFAYLGDLGLPRQDVLVGISERRLVVRNLPDVVERLSRRKRTTLSISLSSSLPLRQACLTPL